MKLEIITKMQSIQVILQNFCLQFCWYFNPLIYHLIMLQSSMIQEVIRIFKVAVDFLVNLKMVYGIGILPHALELYLGFYQTSKPCGNDITSELMNFKTSG